MSDTGKSILTLLLVLAISLISFWQGYWLGKSVIQQDAIKREKAEWVADQATGNVHFRWK